MSRGSGVRFGWPTRGLSVRDRGPASSFSISRVVWASRVGSISAGVTTSSTACGIRHGFFGAWRLCGRTFSVPLLVTDVCSRSFSQLGVDASPGRPGPVHNPIIAVNRRGVVAISWYDAREDPRSYRDSFRCQHVYFAASLDGGSTVLPDVKVSSAENCPDTPANGEAGARWKAGGDYHGLAAAADGRFHLLWADSREGIYQLRTAHVEIGLEAGPPR
jgi:hypothetical protein